MKIVCAKSVVLAEQLFSEIGEVSIVPDQLIDHEIIKDSDILITRSKTRITSDVVKNSKLKVVATATSGVEHVDIELIESLGIKFISAAGSNAASVAEYVACGLAIIVKDYAYSIQGKILGIIGCGNIGGKLRAMAKALGIQLLINDPFLDPNGDIDNIVELPELLERSDLISIHTPLVLGGEHPTLNLIDTEAFAKMKPGCVLVNAARGEIIATQALISAIQNGTIQHAVIDVWENEPHYSVELRNLVNIATPHIAGYSHSARVKGSFMLYSKICEHLGLPLKFTLKELIQQEQESIELPVTPEHELVDIFISAFDVRGDHAKFSKFDDESAEDRAENFNRLRREYGRRLEFSDYKINSKNLAPGLAEKLTSLDFNCY